MLEFEQRSHYSGSFFSPDTPVFYTLLDRYLIYFISIILLYVSIQLWATEPRQWLNRASTELWNSEALGLCDIAPPGLQEPSIEHTLGWGPGSSLVRQVPCVGDAIVEVGLKNLRSSRRILGGVCGIGLRFLSSSWFISELRDAPPTTSLAPMPRRLKMKGWVRWLKRFIISVSLVSPKPPSMSWQHH